MCFADAFSDSFWKGLETAGGKVHGRLWFWNTDWCGLTRAGTDRANEPGRTLRVLSVKAGLRAS
jgi:hypothetical protein